MPRPDRKRAAAIAICLSVTCLVVALAQPIPAPVARTLLRMATGARAVDPVFTGRILGRVTRTDPEAARRLVNRLGLSDPRAAKAVLDGLTRDESVVIGVDLAREIEQAARRAAEGGPPRPVAAEEVSTLFGDDRAVLAASRQVLIDEVLTEVPIIVVGEDGRALASAGHPAAIARAVPDDVRAMLQDVLELPVPADRNLEPLKTQIEQAARKHRFEFEMSSGKLRIPLDKEVLGGRVSFGEINVYRAIMWLVAGSASAPWLVDAWRTVTGGDETYEVKPGDTLWGIAEQFYGEGGVWRRIARANGIDDPEALVPGTALIIPREEP